MRGAWSDCRRCAAQPARKAAGQRWSASHSASTCSAGRARKREGAMAWLALDGGRGAFGVVPTFALPNQARAPSSAWRRDLPPPAELSRRGSRADEGLTILGCRALSASGRQATREREQDGAWPTKEEGAWEGGIEKRTNGSTRASERIWPAAKRPREESQARARVQAGSWEDRRVWPRREGEASRGVRRRQRPAKLQGR
jgi:hypothetical protein